jgi:hypothetical protein
MLDIVGSQLRIEKNIILVYNWLAVVGVENIVNYIHKNCKGIS